MVIELNDMLFTRGEDGELIGQEVTLNTLKDKPIVRIKPLTRGKLQEIHRKGQGPQ